MGEMLGSKSDQENTIQYQGISYDMELFPSYDSFRE